MNSATYRVSLLAVGIGLCELFATAAFAQAQPGDNVSPQSASRVVATVSDAAIYAYEVEREVSRAVGERQLAPSATDKLRSVALQKLIDQRLIVQYARDRQRLVGETHFKQAWSRMVGEMKLKGMTVNAYLRSSRRLDDELTQAVWWEVSWNAIVAAYRTDENLEKYFERHRRDYDGTRLKVAQILFKLPAAADAEVVTATREYAESIRHKIVAKDIAFADAAKQYSQAPSAEKGGEIGWIERHQPMPPEFSTAAFGLASGEVSTPISTKLGVHLIQVVEVKAGDRQWRDVRAELEPAVDRYLFRWVAGLQRPHAKIELNVQTP